MSDDTDRPIVREALEALAPLHPVDRDQARQLLATWARRHELTDDEREQVLATFPAPEPGIQDVTGDTVNTIKHPRWCRNRTECLSIGVHVGQVHPINPDRTSGDETALICAWLAQGVHPAESLHAIVLQITDEGVTRHHWLPVGQARVLVHVVRQLLDEAK